MYYQNFLEIFEVILINLNKLETCRCRKKSNKLQSLPEESFGNIKK